MKWYEYLFIILVFVAGGISFLFVDKQCNPRPNISAIDTTQTIVYEPLPPQTQSKEKSSPAKTIIKPDSQIVKQATFENIYAFPEGTIIIVTDSIEYKNDTLSLFQNLIHRPVQKIITRETSKYYPVEVKPIPNWFDKVKEWSFIVVLTQVALLLFYIIF